MYFFRLPLLFAFVSSLRLLDFAFFSQAAVLPTLSEIYVLGMAFVVYWLCWFRNWSVVRFQIFAC
jgi:hypothetical protein